MVDDVHNFDGEICKIVCFEEAGKDFAVADASEDWGIKAEGL